MMTVRMILMVILEEMEMDRWLNRRKMDGNSDEEDSSDDKSNSGEDLNNSGDDLSNSDENLNREEWKWMCHQYPRTA